MTQKIRVNDVTLTYASLAEARTMSGLRLILGEVAVPGPWREACKGIFHVKKIPYTPVATAGKDGSQRELIEWTAQSSAPVAIWNDERPRSTWIEQLYLAERLQPEPALIPANAGDRVLMFGLINEIAGENGIGWQRRQTLIHGTVSNPKTDQRTRDFWRRFGSKYLYSEEAAAAASRASRIDSKDAGGTTGKSESQRQQVLHQRSALGPRHLLGDVFRDHPAAAGRAVPDGGLISRYVHREESAGAGGGSPLLFEHRDFIYREYLELPIVF